MNTFEEKRKNDDRRLIIPNWVWALVIGFILGVVATLIVVPQGVQSTVYVQSSEGMELTATRIIQQATEMAGGVFVAPDNDAQGTPMTDELFMTATAIIQQATQTAGS